MASDGAGRWTGVRVFGWTCAVGAVLGSATAIWVAAVHRDVVTGCVLLMVTALLAPAYWLVSRDVRRRARSDAGHASAPPVPGPPEEFGELVAIRPAGYFQDLLRRYVVLVDGHPVGELGRGGEVRVQVPAGRHTVRARIDWTGSAPLEVEVAAGTTVEVTVRPGDLARAVTSSGYLSLVPGRRG